MSSLLKSLQAHSFTLLLISTVVAASVFPASGEFASWFKLATDCAIALLFFLHGARLAREVAIAGLLHWRLHLTILAITFVVFPVAGLAFALVPESVLPAPLYLGLLFVCLLPSTVQSSIALVSLGGGNVPAAICSSSTSNLLGIFITPLLAGFLMSTGNGADAISFGSVGKIATLLLAPFIAGQLLQPLIGGWVRRHKSLLNPIDRGSIMMVVYVAFSGAVIDGLWRTVSLYDLGILVGLEFVLLAAVLVASVLIARVLGFKRPDEVVILFCGSQKSLATGVPIASVLFAGQAVGPIVLPMMIYHQMQLMVGSFLAQRYARQNDKEAVSGDPLAVGKT